MNKVINSKMYDTATAELIKKVFFGEIDDPDVITDALYRKKNGEFFYCVCPDDPDDPTSYSIIPCCEDYAKLWVEENCSGDKYVELFGEVEE